MHANPKDRVSNPAALPKADGECVVIDCDFDVLDYARHLKDVYQKVLELEERVRTGGSQTSKTSTALASQVYDETRNYVLKVDKISSSIRRALHDDTKSHDEIWKALLPNPIYDSRGALRFGDFPAALRVVAAAHASCNDVFSLISVIMAAQKRLNSKAGDYHQRHYFFINDRRWAEKGRSTLAAEMIDLMDLSYRSNRTGRELLPHLGVPGIPIKGKAGNLQEAVAFALRCVPMLQAEFELTRFCNPVHPTTTVLGGNTLLCSAFKAEEHPKDTDGHVRESFLQTSSRIHSQTEAELLLQRGILVPYTVAARGYVMPGLVEHYQRSNARVFYRELRERMPGDSALIDSVARILERMETLDPTLFSRIDTFDLPVVDELGRQLAPSVHTLIEFAKSLGRTVPMRLRCPVSKSSSISGPVVKRRFDSDILKAHPWDVLQSNLREYRPPEQTFTTKLLSPIVDAKSRTMDFRSGRRTRVITKNLTSLLRLLDELDETIRALRATAEKVIQKAPRGSPVTHTFDQNGVRVRIPDGAIVFENLGQLLTNIALWTRFRNEQIRKYCAHFKVTIAEDAGSPPVTPISILSSIVKSSSSTLPKDGQPAKTDAWLHLKEIGLLSSAQWPHEKLELYAAALRLACTQIFGTVPQRVSKALQAFSFCDPTETTVLTGGRLFEQFKAALRECGLENSNAAAHHYLVNAEKTRARALRLRILTRDIGVPIDTVFRAVCKLIGESESHKQLSAFRERLHLYSGDFGATIPAKELPIGEHFLSFVRDFSDFPQASTDDATVFVLVEVFYQITLRRSNGDPTQTIQEIEEFLDSSRNLKGAGERIRALVQRSADALLERLKGSANVSQPPSIRFPLLPHQLEAIAGARFGKRIINHGTGTGKTCTLAAICEDQKAKRVLFGTLGSMALETVGELQKILIGKEIGIASSETFGGTPESVRKFLDCHTYVVFGYEFFTSLRTNAPLLFQVVREWISNEFLVLDEYGTLDNPKGKHFQTAISLDCRFVVVGAATPIQHREERLANGLTLTHRSLYPDPVAQEQLFRKYPERAQTEFSMYSHRCSLEEISTPFKPFAVSSPAEQLRSGVPHVPRVEERVVEISMGPVASRHYVEAICNFPKWANERGIRKIKRWTQIHALKQLVLDPAALGLACRDWIAGVMALTREEVERGGRVFVMTSWRSPANLYGNDPEIEKYGGLAVTGETEIGDRSKIRLQVEDGTIRAIAGTMKSIGTGFQFRGVTRLIMLDSLFAPATSAQRIQSIGRFARILREGDEKYAVEKIDVCFVRFILDQSIKKDLPSAYHPIFDLPTLYSRWTDSAIKKISRYRDFLSPQTSSKRFDKSNEHRRPALAFLENVRGLVLKEAAFAKGLAADPKVAAEQLRMMGVSKSVWREHFLTPFIEKHRIILSQSKEPGVILGGPTEHEVELWRRVVSPTRIVVCERDRGAKRKVIENICLGAGCHFMAKPVEEFLDAKAPHVSFLSLDGYSSLSMASFRMLASLKFTKRFLLFKNGTAGREFGPARQMLALCNNDRRLLDLLTVKLLGAADRIKLKPGPELVTYAVNVLRASRKIADLVALDALHERALLTDFFFDCTVHAPTITDFEEGNYIVPSGKVFTSLAAAIDSDSAWAQLSEDTQRLIRLQVNLLIADPLEKIRGSDWISSGDFTRALQQYSESVSPLGRISRFLDALEGCDATGPGTSSVVIG